MKAYAKLNLYLNINGILPGGFHEITTVMQRISLCDEVTVKKADGIKVFCDVPSVPTGEKNTAFAAAVEFFKASGIKGGAEIEIVKRIPDGAGMAGGSADAATTLIQLNILYGGPLSEKELFEAALKVGSDVPFCLKGGTALCCGRGEVITPLKPLSGCAFAIVKPPFSVSTPKAYAEYDRTGGDCPPPGRILEGVEKGDLAAICEGMGNALQKPAALMHPEIEDEIKAVFELGAEKAMMTGSGSAVFGVFKKEEDAASAAQSLRALGKNAFCALPL